MGSRRARARPSRYRHRVHGQQIPRGIPPDHGAGTAPVRLGGTIATFDVEITIRPRPGILSPEGQTIERALGDLGYDGIEEVRVGRTIGLRIEAADRTSCERQVREACERLLANPVIEDFEFTVSEGAGQPLAAG